MLLRTGDRLGSYEIQEPIGSGGQAQVYRARHLHDGTTAAIKVPRPEIASALLAEARCLEAVYHPSIVEVLAVEPDHLVLEDCPGGSLEDLLAGRPEGLPLDRVIEIGSAVLQALSLAHEHGVVHRDLKPSNVLFDGEGRPKICDFGIGTTGLGEAWSEREGTAGTCLAGTPHYASPEQEDPDRYGPVGPASDVYSFGKLVFALLTGRSPRVFRLPSSLRAGLDPAWDEFVLSLTEERPEARPSAARALASFQRLPRTPRARSGWARFWLALTALANLAGSAFLVVAGFLPGLEFARRPLLACGLAWAAAGFVAFDVGSRVVRGRSCPSTAVGAATAIPLFSLGLVLVASAFTLEAWPWWTKVQVCFGVPLALLGAVGSAGAVLGARRNA